MSEGADDAAEVAAGLSQAMRGSLAAVRNAWLTKSEMRGATGMALTMLACMTPALVERRWTMWGPDRVHGQLRGEGYEYRLTPLGRRVAAHLTQHGAEDHE